MTNMPIKRRILNSYNNNSHDSTVIGATLISSRRCLYRSKSFHFIVHHSSTKKIFRRSTSLPSRLGQIIGENLFLSKSIEQRSSKSKSEPIDLTEENFPMPMIVNVEENVELAHQRQQMKSNCP